jgi:DNA-binding transcriptional MerR regulator
MADRGENGSGIELTIDELSRESGMTARNIRAHQSRGLLPPPAVRSRTGFYGPEHISRIKLIQDMQAQGFNLKSIERLLEIGAGAGDEGDFQRALLKPFGDEEPETIGADELAEAFAAPIDRKLVARAERIGLLNPIGEGVWEVPSPTMLRAGRELIAIGVPLDHALAVAGSINKHTAAIAREFVRLFIKDVLEPLRAGGDEHDLARAGEALERVRPLASEAVMASFAQVMTRAVERQLEKERAD